MLALWRIVIAAQGTQGSSALTGTDLWIPVIAALGGAFLTGAVAFGMEWWRARKAGKAAKSERRTRAYSLLLARSAVIVHIASGLHIAMATRSGLREGINVATGKRKLVDPLDLIALQRTDLEPLYDAWSEVWTWGSDPCSKRSGCTLRSRDGGSYTARNIGICSAAIHLWREVDTTATRRVEEGDGGPGRDP